MLFFDDLRSLGHSVEQNVTELQKKLDCDDEESTISQASAILLLRDEHQELNKLIGKGKSLLNEVKRGPGDICFSTLGMLSDSLLEKTQSSCTSIEHHLQKYGYQSINPSPPIEAVSLAPHQETSAVLSNENDEAQLHAQSLEDKKMQDLDYSPQPEDFGLKNIYQKYTKIGEFEPQTTTTSLNVEPLSTNACINDASQPNNSINTLVQQRSWSMNDPLSYLQFNTSASENFESPPMPTLTMNYTRLLAEKHLCMPTTGKMKTLTQVDTPETPECVASYNKDITEDNNSLSTSPKPPQNTLLLIESHQVHNTPEPNMPQMQSKCIESPQTPELTTLSIKDFRLMQEKGSQLEFESPISNTDLGFDSNSPLSTSLPIDTPNHWTNPLKTKLTMVVDDAVMDSPQFPQLTGSYNFYQNKLYSETEKGKENMTPSRCSKRQVFSKQMSSSLSTPKAVLAKHFEENINSTQPYRKSHSHIQYNLFVAEMTAPEHQMQAPFLQQAISLQEVNGTIKHLNQVIADRIKDGESLPYVKNTDFNLSSQKLRIFFILMTRLNRLKQEQRNSDIIYLAV